ncbi:MAG: ferrochelatase [Chlorobiaceae bacterium]|nr:ferrochelatase [Chlorobiaceae bacterium]
MTARRKIAVILASHGEAETPGFIENYRVSLHTLSHASTVMRIPVPLRHLISLSSSLKKRFRKAPGAAGSPQNLLTREQAALLQQHLDRHPASSGIAFDVRAAHSASRPYVEQVLAQTSGHDGQVVVPMAPVDNALSCGLICAHLSEARHAGELHRVRVVGRLWNDDALIRSYLDHLFATGRKLPERAGPRNLLLLTFHGTLVRDASGREPDFRTGRDETASFARRLTAAIEADDRNPWGTVMVAYLNHDVGGEWTRPSFEEAGRAIKDGGYDGVWLFAAGYFSDGNETLHRAAQLSAAVPGLGVEALPCLNGSPGFAEYLAGRVTRAAVQILRFSGDGLDDVASFA